MTNTIASTCSEDRHRSQLCVRWRLVALVATLTFASTAEHVVAQNTLDKAEAASAVLDVDESDDLDSLLDMADTDPEQLSRVRVQSVDRGVSVESFDNAPSFGTKVSTVSRQDSTVGRSPAAVFVITNEMIRRSGAQNVPDLLRMAPGVQVARIDANKWAISIRGFNGRFANKLLVQIDGRTVYTPFFGGVFWDVQDMVLEDIQRIEVVRGPGAAVWGVNAVNGVINIITKSSAETQGAYAKVGAGSEERGFVTARYGGQVDESLSYRVYGKWFDRERAFPLDGPAEDGWSIGRGGFRTDWKLNSQENLTVQGDLYDGSGGQTGVFPVPTPPFANQRSEDKMLRGGNGLVRWTSRIDDDNDWSLQAYYDRTERSYLGTGFSETRDTFDIDFQRRTRFSDFHNIVWGGGYRHTTDQIGSDPFWVGALPSQRGDNLFSLFAQDEMQLTEKAFFTLGCKLTHDDYTGLEVQPTARFLYAPSERQSIWASVSRAVRAPSRAGDDISIVVAPPPFLPPGAFPQVLGNRNVGVEDLVAYEIGMRGQPSDWLSWDAAAFFHEYDNLVGTSTGAPFAGGGVLFVPQRFSNLVDGYAYGAELFGHLMMTEQWSLSGNYTYLQMHTSDDGDGESPRNQFFVQSSHDVGEDWECDLMLRYVDDLPAHGIDAYTVMDIRMAWTPTRDFEAGVVGRNLFDSEHPEFGSDQFTGNLSTQIQREVFGYMVIRR